MFFSNYVQFDIFSVTDKFSAKQVGKMIGLEICKKLTMDVLTVWIISL